MTPEPEKSALAPLVVRITREPYIETFILHLPDGQTEELEPEEARTWFRVRGADMDVVEKAMDYCWNFYKSAVTIKNPRQPAPPVNQKIRPRLD